MTRLLQIMRPTWRAGPGPAKPGSETDWPTAGRVTREEIARLLQAELADRRPPDTPG